jgi:hypothetical protein
MYPRILRPLLRWGDTLWNAQRSMSEDSVCHHTDFSTLYCSSMAYMGIESHFDLWNYFFLAQL